MTRNLANALLYLRYREAPRILWIDAICVNQTDLAERGSQVSHTAEIYKGAARVIVWLGVDSLRSTEALKILRSLSSCVEINWGTRTVRSFHAPVPSSSHERHLQQCTDLGTRFEFDESQIGCLAHLLGRSWFDRLWIWQEVRLASADSIVQYGRETLLWDNLSAAVYLLIHKTYSPEVESDACYLLRRKLRLAFHLCSKQGNGVKTLLAYTQYSKCSDNRDRIYTLLSLYVVNVELTVKVDYTKSGSEVYEEATRRLLLDCSVVSILAGIKMQEHEQEPRND